MSEKMKRATKESLLARAQMRQATEVRYKEFESKLLGETLMIKKLPLEQVCGIMDMAGDGDSLIENVELNCQLIYESIPLFQDKELQEAYGCTEPQKIVTAVLDDNMGEMKNLCEAILGMYGLTEAVEDIKN